MMKRFLHNSFERNKIFLAYLIAIQNLVIKLQY